ncbi:MAG TPA: TlpA disulfide reductase family protein [Candidatus Kapabacteria bacterium]|nr:TlpA disulfide reductase family protein [Candidatus Kapabacteria bacterium]
MRKPARLFFTLLLTALPAILSAQTPADSVRILDNLKFNVRTVTGDEVNFGTYLGKGPLLVSFWALWCEPCKQEMKAFKVLTDRFISEGVHMVAINTDQVRSVAKVRAFVATQRLDFPVLLDPDGDIARDIFSMESLPYSLILMPDGSVYSKHIGYTAGDEQATEKELVELIAKLKQKGG